MSISVQFLPQKTSAHFQFQFRLFRLYLFVTPEIIAKKIKQIKHNKSPGIDGIKKMKDNKSPGVTTKTA